MLWRRGVEELGILVRELLKGFYLNYFICIMFGDMEYKIISVDNGLDLVIFYFYFKSKLKIIKITYV